VQYSCKWTQQQNVDKAKVHIKEDNRCSEHIHQIHNIAEKVRKWLEMSVWRRCQTTQKRVYGHFGPSTLRTQDISAPYVWCQSVSNFCGGAEMSQTLRH